MRYSIRDNGDDFANSLPLEDGRLDDLDGSAEDAAMDYHRNHDGWEAMWPVIIDLWEGEGEGEYLGGYEVERVPEPVFYAKRAPRLDNIKESGK